MLSFILTLMAIGAVLGLVFSRKGEEKEGVISGAKSGAGCALELILIPVIIIVVIVLIVALAA